MSAQTQQDFASAYTTLMEELHGAEDPPEANANPTEEMSDAHVMQALFGSDAVSGFVATQASTAAAAAPPTDASDATDATRNMDLVERWKIEMEFSLEALLHYQLARDGRDEGRALSGASGDHASLIVALGDLEAKHRNNEDKLSNVSGVANIEFSAHVTFFHWEDAATNFGRPCRMDKDQKLVWSVPSVIKSRKVDIGEIIMADVGVSMDKTVRFPVPAEVVRLKRMWSQAFVSKHAESSDIVCLVPCFICGRGQEDRLQEAVALKLCACCLLASHHSCLMALVSAVHALPQPDCPDGVGMPEAFEPLEATLCLACARFVGVARSVALKNKSAKQYDSTTSHLAIQTSSESGQHVRWHGGL